MHPHQVPHGQCCTSTEVQDCTGSCTSASWVGNDLCNANLDCYCEEQASTPCVGINLPCPFAPHAGYVFSTHMQVRASHWGRDRCRVDSEPLVSPCRHQPSTPLLLGWTRLLFGGIVYPGGPSITPSTPTSLYWCHSNVMLCITSGSAGLVC
jgi:hypothetical protein